MPEIKPKAVAKKPTHKMVYEVSLGRKDISDFMRGCDLGVDGYTSNTFIITLTTSTPTSDELIEAHKKGIRKFLEQEYYVGEIKFVQ